jgi:hypothetical protein
MAIAILPQGFADGGADAAETGLRRTPTMNQPWKLTERAWDPRLQGRGSWLSFRERSKTLSTPGQALWGRSATGVRWVHGGCCANRLARLHQLRNIDAFREPVVRGQIRRSVVLPGRSWVTARSRAERAILYLRIRRAVRQGWPRLTRKAHPAGVTELGDFAFISL